VTESPHVVARFARTMLLQRGVPVTEQPATPRFFPLRSEREVLGEVIADFPYPLALTYARLQDELGVEEYPSENWR